MVAKRRSILVISTLLAGMMLGAPVFGALESLFWSSGGHIDDAADAAVQIYAQTGLDPERAALGGEIWTSKCGINVYQRSQSPETSGEGEIILIYALNRAFRLSLASRYDSLAIASLYELPAPILGALKGCFSGGPASIFCKDYVIKRVDRATNVSSEVERAWLAEANRDIEKAWCAADPAS